MLSDDQLEYYVVRFSFSRTVFDFRRYEPEFFSNVVNGRDIVSWGVVDRSRRDGRSDELVGFVTARIVPAKDSEVSLSDLLSLVLFPTRTSGGLTFRQVN